MSDEIQAVEEQKHELKSEEALLRELEKYPKQKLTKDDVNRVTQMVKEYQGKIKAYLSEQQEKRETCVDRFADQVANFCGSWRFLIILGFILATWIIWDDSRQSLFIISFTLSIFTAFQAAMIQMSQNQQARKDKQEQLLGIAINYKAEQENLEIQRYLKQIENRLCGMERQLTQKCAAETKDTRNGPDRT